MDIRILDNGIKVIYEKTSSDITSICIGLEAGAAVEEGKMGLAHATEHMLYKGTINRSEEKINEELSDIFAFQNAMTNYPYVIYYGSLLNEDFNSAVELFSDIIINPTFPKEGFKEEMDVIIQELNEWDEELEQFCEDKLFFNALNNRLKYPIIGVQEDLKTMTLEDIKNFYNEFYYPKNTTISVVSSLEFSEVTKIIENYFLKWDKNINKEINNNLTLLKEGIFNDSRKGVKNAKVEIVYNISNLSNEELGILKIFDEYFGSGVNSVLFNELRTKTGLVYDILTYISYEKYIGMYKIIFSTSIKKVKESIKIVNDAIENIKIINEKDILNLIKRIKLKKLFKEEQGVVLAKELTVNSIMEREITIDKNITGEEIFNLVKKVLVSPSIEIITDQEEN